LSFVKEEVEPLATVMQSKYTSADMDIDLNQIVTPAKSEISEFDIVSSINTYYKPEKLGDKINLEEFISKNESSVKKFEDGEIDSE
jgi:hypothetical protein